MGSQTQDPSPFIDDDEVVHLCAFVLLSAISSNRNTRETTETIRLYFNGWLPNWLLLLLLFVPPLPILQRRGEARMVVKLNCWLIFRRFEICEMIVFYFRHLFFSACCLFLRFNDQRPTLYNL
jgi:hypothetical protein